MPVKYPQIFDVNWPRFSRMLTPWELRKKRVMAMMYTVLGTLGLLHGRFTAFRLNTQYRIGINYQTCRLEKLLNDSYDNVLRRIYIVNKPTPFLPLLLYTKEESKPLKLYQESEDLPLFLYAKSETPAGLLNFIIMVPADLVFIENELLGLVRVYCLQTKIFKVQVYE